MKELLKKISIGLVVLPLLGVLAVSTATRSSSAAVQDFDATATFKAKCAMCHTATASKNFDPAKTDEQLVEAILKGVKTEKPPAMPSYEAKGVTPDQAKALAAYMRTLKQQ
jgi:mono/diheme cytochrome c family protein